VARTALTTLTPLLVGSLLLVGCGGSRSSRTLPSSTASGATPSTSTSTTAPTTTSTPPPPPPPVANFQRVGWETVDVGSDSARGFSQGAHEDHVATAADWPFFWMTHSSATLPAIDFTSQSVVGTFMGQIGGGSHTTRIVNVWHDVNGDDLRALVREFRLAAWKPNTRNLTSPFHIVRCDAAVSGQGTLHVDRQTLLDFEVLTAGSDSAIGANDPTYQGGLQVFRDAASFGAFYALHQPNARPPGIDFQREMVVAVLGGYYGQFGNTVETLRLLHDPATDEIRVVSRVNPYRGGAAPPPATETPFQLLRVTPASGSIRPETRARASQTPLAAGTTRLYTGPSDTQVIRDAAAFSALWTARVGGPAPIVDFATDQVVAVFEPEVTRKRVSIPTVEVWEDDETYVVVNTTVLFGPPSTGAPYELVTTPRTDGPVQFEVIDTTPRP
jgi:hypothetical protein